MLDHQTEASRGHLFSYIFHIFPSVLFIYFKLGGYLLRWSLGSHYVPDGHLVSDGIRGRVENRWGEISVLLLTSKYTPPWLKSLNFSSVRVSGRVRSMTQL